MNRPTRRAGRRPAQRGAVFATAVGVVLAAATGCADGFFHDPAPDGPARVAVTFRQSSGGAGAAFDAADNLALEVRSAGETLVSESVPVSASGGPLEARLDVTLPEGATTAVLDVTVRRASDDLFEGSATVELAPGATSEVTISLSPVVAGLDLTTPPTFTVFGQTAPLEGDAVFATGDVVPGIDVGWESLDPEVVSVEPVSTGGFRAVAHADGSAMLRGSYGSRTATVVAEVSAVAVSVEVLPSSATLTPDQTIDFTAMLRDAGGSPIPGRTPNWSSSDEQVARVSGGGTVTGVAPGEADVTAEADGASGSASVTVRYPGPDVATLDATDLTVSGATLRAQVDPLGSTTSVVFEYGSDPDLAQPATTSPVVVAGSSPSTEVTRTISQLQENTTYYVRAVATNGLGTTQGATLSFTTLDAPDIPTSLAGSYNGGVLISWVDNSDNETRFEIEREVVAQGPNYQPPTPSGPARTYQPLASVGAGVTQFQDPSPIGGEARYRVRACADAACSPYTPPLTWFFGVTPGVQTRPVTNIFGNQATLSAFVNPFNAPTTVYWQVSYDPTFTTPPPMVFPASPLPAGSGNVDVIRSTIANSLSAGYTYYVRAIAVNTWGVSVGNTVSFMTSCGECQE